VENLTPLLAWLIYKVASMRPRPCDRGELTKLDFFSDP
jgi:hypothetical protein